MKLLVLLNGTLEIVELWQLTSAGEKQRFSKPVSHVVSIKLVCLRSRRLSPPDRCITRTSRAMFGRDQCVV